MKSWRGPRVVIGLAAATLSLIYFVTLVWGPKDPAAAGAQNYLKELGDQPRGVSPEDAPGEGLGSAGEKQTPPGEVPGGDEVRDDTPPEEQPLGQATGALRPDELYTMRFEVRQAETRLPVPGATVHVAKAAGDQREIASFGVDAEGYGRVGKLPHAQYRYWVEAPGFHPSDAQAVELPLDGDRFRIDLRPAAQVVGVFEGRDGKARQLGVLHLTQPESRRVLWLEADRNGRFVSPPLDEGRWQLAWMRNSRAQPEPGMFTELELPAGQRTLLEVILPEGSEGTLSVRRPGIRKAIAGDQLRLRSSQKLDPSSSTAASSR